MRRARGLEYEVQGHGEAVLFIHGSHFAGAFVPLMDQPALADRFRLIRHHLQDRFASRATGKHILNALTVHYGHRITNHR